MTWYRPLAGSRAVVVVAVAKGRAESTSQVYIGN